MATKYELPEEADANLLSNLGEEVKMKTFKTNVPPTLECDKDQAFGYKNYLPRGLHVWSGKKRGAYQGLSASHTAGTDRLLSASINRLRLSRKNHKM